MTSDKWFGTLCFSLHPPFDTPNQTLMCSFGLTSKSETKKLINQAREILGFDFPV
jgi:hypothetical protein